MRKKRYLTDRGFTIIELMIASAVFTVVLMAALAGFLQVGRLFYKGTSQTTTQEVAKQVLNNVSESIMAASSTTPSNPYGGGGHRYLCIGNVRYSYLLEQPVNSSVDNLSSGVAIGLVRDTLPGANACKPPCPLDTGIACGAGAIRWNNPVELLGNNMRLQGFSVQQPNPLSNPDYYTVDIMVAFGEDEVLEEEVAGDPLTIRCKGNSANQQFCAVARYSASVKRGMDI